MGWNNLDSNELVTGEQVEDGVSEGDLDWSSGPPPSSMITNEHWTRGDYETYVNHDDDPVNGLPSANLAVNEHMTQQLMFLFAIFAPDAPSLSVLDSGDQFVEVGWSVGIDTTFTELYRSTVNKSTPDPGDLIDTFPEEETSFVDSGLTNNTTYYYWVRAIGPGGESDFSNRVDAMPEDTAPPPPPSVILSYDPSNSGAACGLWPSDTDTYYLDDELCFSLDLGCNLYTDTGLSNDAPTGFYSDGESWYDVQAGEIVSTGSCLN